MLRDETERKRAEDLLKSSLQEKELLLREIHHRVNNNLHVITGLLSLQAGQVQDGKVQHIFDDLQDRVRAIAALHETLSSSRDLANIAFGPYMQQLLHDLVAFYGIDRERIQVRIETDDVVLSSEQALPLGLIVNELVSNSLKHAFPGGRRGAIDVRFHYAPKSMQAVDAGDAAWCELLVHDDGAGIKNTDRIRQRKSMGLRLVNLLTEQLHGTVSLDQSHSTQFSVRFPLDEFKYAAEAQS
ncbi:MAG: sensor histidine kinase [Bryobacteraceae bacterium]